MSTFVQSKSNGSTGSATTLAATFSDPVRVGNTILAFLYSQAATVTSLADGLSNSYTQDFNHTATAGKKYFYSAPVTTGGSCTITWTFPSDSLPREMIIVEHRNLASSPFDTSDSTSANSNSNTNPVVSGAITPAQNLELLVGIYNAANGDTTGTTIRGFGHSLVEASGSTSWRLGYVDQVINTTNTQKTGFTWNNAGIQVGVFALLYKINNYSDPAFQINKLRPAIFKPGLAR